ncbi:20806_t:CDS:2 [Racocetra persica]|uniref:20806_t:CDS:1 n=1 Tax=Racocetra persica TaxID=160502 RepID=A0ACA9PAI0_9GLOM|nr:20806_t:CDS:2 [Racocetra persica]
MNSSDDLIQKCLIDWRIKFYEYTRFKDIELIGEGGHGKVYRATHKNNEITVALKSFKSNNVTIKEIVNELKLHCKVDMHSNIIRLHGATKNEDQPNLSSLNYMFVLEYADSGTLRSYLRNHFNYLSWNDKINFALQIASAIKSLHAEDIIHRDLHSNNILIHQKNPQSFEGSRNENRTFIFNKKSDVYSVGVLLWELSSGYPPFKDDVKPYQLASLIVDIKNGVRETHIEGTPSEYIKIYSECWQHNPDSRPDIQQVFLGLKNLITNNKQSINRIAQDSNTLETHGSTRNSLFISDSTEGILMQNTSSSLLN